ncbi:hypothetical protein EYF80_049345 [Liparis tanakae]|uniref:Uncharacterized protein n=1 Tax=Liparis tanakae TaxID=230148 RepID=A0A4Z2FGY8_9TELE|nr:hypothetical protein EYF80_049345 [Liparis tanakae]
MVKPYTMENNASLRTSQIADVQCQVFEKPDATAAFLHRGIGLLCGDTSRLLNLRRSLSLPPRARSERGHLLATRSSESTVSPPAGTGATPVVAKQFKVQPPGQTTVRCICKPITQAHLSEEVLVPEPVPEQQDVGVPALLGAPPQVLSHRQSQVPRIVAEPQQTRPVRPHLGQTSRRRGQRRPSEQHGAVSLRDGGGLLLLCEQLQQLAVARRPCQLKRRDPLLVGQTHGHQAAGLTQQQLGQPTQTPPHGQVEGRLPGGALCRTQGEEKWNNRQKVCRGIEDSCRLEGGGGESTTIEPVGETTFQLRGISRLAMASATRRSIARRRLSWPRLKRLLSSLWSAELRQCPWTTRCSARSWECWQE